MATEPKHYISIPLKSCKHSKSVVCRISGSPDSLPLNIVATDGQSPFRAKCSLTTRPELTLVTKNDVRGGKSKSFDGTDEEWQQLVLGALFGMGKKDVQLSAQISKDEDRITVRAAFKA